jgi:PadR family transcriptional regulator, regulatory protein PadR
MAPANSSVSRKALSTPPWLKAQWGTSEANRKAKFYELSAAGRKQLAAERQRWDRLAAGMTRLLES